MNQSADTQNTGLLKISYPDEGESKSPIAVALKKKREKMALKQGVAQKEEDNAET